MNIKINTFPVYKGIERPPVVIYDGRPATQVLDNYDIGATIDWILAVMNDDKAARYHVETYGESRGWAVVYLDDYEEFKPRYIDALRQRLSEVIREGHHFMLKFEGGRYVLYDRVSVFNDEDTANFIANIVDEEVEVIKI